MCWCDTGSWRRACLIVSTPLGHLCCRFWPVFTEWQERRLTLSWLRYSRTTLKRHVQSISWGGKCWLWAVVFWSVPAVSGRPACHASFSLHWRVGPRHRSSCGEHGTGAGAGCHSTQHHWHEVRAKTLFFISCHHVTSTRFNWFFYFNFFLHCFTSDDLEFPRSWLVPVIRDHVKNTHLGFFTSYFLPLASTLKQRGEKCVGAGVSVVLFFFFFSKDPFLLLQVRSWNKEDRNWRPKSTTLYSCR